MGVNKYLKKNVLCSLCKEETFGFTKSIFISNYMYILSYLRMFHVWGVWYRWLHIEKSVAIIVWIQSREHQRGNQKWTIQRNWRHWTKTNNTKTQHRKPKRQATRIPPKTTVESRRSRMASSVFLLSISIEYHQNVAENIRTKLLEWVSYIW